MQAPDKIHGRGALSSFLLRLYDCEMNGCYLDFLVEQGFKEFLRIPLYSMRHAIPETLVQRFHAKTTTFHLSCGEYIVLPFDWTAILGLRFGGYPVPSDLINFSTASKLLGIRYPLSPTRR